MRSLSASQSPSSRYRRTWVGTLIGRSLVHLSCKSSSCPFNRLTAFASGEARTTCLYPTPTRHTQEPTTNTPVPHHSTAYCWGNFAGPFVVVPSQAPNYPGASIGLLVGYAIKMVCHILLLAYMWHSNRRRDKVYGTPDKERSQEAGMQDKTEFENKDFRYVL